jgi:hypothetical protein
MVKKWFLSGLKLVKVCLHLQKKKKRQPKLVYGCPHLAEFTQHYKTGYFDRPIGIYFI